MLRQSPVSSTVSVGNFVAALLVEADLVECGIKVFMSMPALLYPPCKSVFGSWPIWFWCCNKQTSYATPESFGYIYVLPKQFHRTNICLFIDWKFYLYLIIVATNLSSIHIIRKFSAIVMFRMSIANNIFLPHWPHNIANNEANLREISSKDFWIMEFKYLSKIPNIKNTKA